MKNVWETCTFSDEIVSTDFNRAKFAIELHEFLDNTAGPIYQDPRRFFENTFPTNQMKLLVKDSLVRLESGKGQPVTVINTGFGGGKTHSILLLHHIINHPEAGLEFIKKINLTKEYGIEKIPKAKMIAIDCRKITKNTLWGEIADQLGQYEKFKELDVAKKAPLDISLIKSLFEEPTLLLLDELPHYLLKIDTEKLGNKTLAELTISVLMDFISSVSASKNSCMILTLTDKQKLYEDYTSEIISKSKSMQDYRTDDVIDKLGEAISRQTQIITPVERSQIYDVIRTRMVREINSAERDKTVREYSQYYKDNGIVLELDFEEKLSKSYPFHPFLIDTLYDRVSTISKFNQTRGMLRLLGRVIRQIKEEKLDCKIISLSDIQLTNHEIADELTSRLGLDLLKVINTDCTEHAQKLDEHKTLKIVESIARTIYVFSLHGHSKKSGIKRAQIKLSVGYPGMEPSLIDKALDEDILENFWYIRDKDNQEFYFVESPNINAIIHEHKHAVSPNEKRIEIGKSLINLLPSKGFSPIIWDEHDLKDSEDLKIFIIDYSKKLSDDSAIDYITKILDRTSNGGIRTNKNTIVFVYADPDSVYTLERQAEQLIAIKKARKDERIHANDSFLKQISSKESSATSQLESDCLTVYCKIGYPNGIQPRLDEIRFLESKKNTITDEVKELLDKKGKLVEKISVDGIEIPEDIKKVNSIYKSFKENKSQPFLVITESISDAIKEGTRDGKFGFCNEIQMVGDKYVAEINKECFAWGGYIVNKDKIHFEDTPEQTSPTSAPTSGGTQETFGDDLFRYQIDFDNFTEILNFINRVGLLNLKNNWKSSRKQFNAKVKVGDTAISIESSLSDYMVLKGLLNSITGKDPSGTGYLTIDSEVDLQKDFKEIEIDARKI